ncbi:MAG TPA: hypothetical protein VMV35_02270 [Halothiobacillus sp.]|nr:hypothetical protein [Halothiobacillus sp.]
MNSAKYEKECILPKQSTQIYPGGGCEVKRIEPIRRVNWRRILLKIFFIVVIVSIPEFNLLNIQNPYIITPMNCNTIDFDNIQ